MLFCEVNHANSADDSSNYDIDACCSMVDFAESYSYNHLEMKGNPKNTTCSYLHKICNTIY